MPSAELSIKVIIDRVKNYYKCKNKCKNSKKAKPMFIFRGYNKYWEPAFEYYIKEHNLKEHNLGLEDLEDFFWLFNGQNARISDNNMMSVSNYNRLEKYNEELKKESWNEFNNILPINMKDKFRS
ncbi:hypothetical protein [Apilactobacillus micheneri]|uniref:hypothetical protein n=1 Tax=Apilactobacillus micheneri TaxID=1899430 RepID=UPI0015E84EBE|nr:hypothetical protein [Apilactobacillus micheneri]